MPTRNSLVLQNPGYEASQVLGNYYIDNFDGIAIFPIDVFDIAARKGIRIIQNAFLDRDQAGLLVRRNPSEPVEIHLNARDGYERQRFTVAHELGHYVALEKAGLLDSEFGFIENRDELSSTGTDPVEVCSNNFAAELLMPNIAVQMWASDGWSFEEIRKKLQVSRLALQHKFKTLGLPLP